MKQLLWSMNEKKKKMAKIQQYPKISFILLPTSVLLFPKTQKKNLTSLHFSVNHLQKTKQQRKCYVPLGELQRPIIHGISSSLLSHLSATLLGPQSPHHISNPIPKNPPPPPLPPPPHSTMNKNVFGNSPLMTKTLHLMWGLMAVLSSPRHLPSLTSPATTSAPTSNSRTISFQSRFSLWHFVEHFLCVFEFHVFFFFWILRFGFSGRIP